MTTVLDPARNVAPRAVRLAVLGWGVAVLAGFFETLVVAATEVTSETGDVTPLLAQVAGRVVLLSAALWTAFRLLEGRAWARILLTVGLSVLGLASLLVGPVEWLAGDRSVGDALAGATVSDWLFGGSRAVHVLAVVSATVLMYRPSANAFFRGPRTPR